MLIYRQYAQTLLTKWNSIPLQKTLRLIFENSIYGAVSKRNRTGFCPSFASKNPKRFFLFGFLCVLWVSPLDSALHRLPYLAGVCSASKNLITIDAISALVVPFFGFIFSMPLSLLPDMYPLSIPNLIGSCA